MLGQELNVKLEEAYLAWQRINDSLSIADRAKITHGHFSFGCQILGASKGLNHEQILDAVSKLTKYTKRPSFAILEDASIQPYKADGALEASFATMADPDPGRVDFWRVYPDGFVYLLRGYAEDAMEPEIYKEMGRDKGSALEATLPMWAVGEFLLRVDELANIMYEPGYSLQLVCEWTGLRNRMLFSNRRSLPPIHRATVDSVISREIVSGKDIQEQLPEVVKALVFPLFDSFSNRFVPLPNVFEEEIRYMKNGRRYQSIYTWGLAQQKP